VTALQAIVELVLARIAQAEASVDLTVVLRGLALLVAQQQTVPQAIATKDNALLAIFLVNAKL
jgi:hypothetical protein